MNPLRDTVGVLTKHPEYYDAFEFFTEVGVISTAPMIVGGNPKSSVKKSDSNSTESGNRRKINKELHQKINNRKEEHYLNLQSDKQVKAITTGYRNFEHISEGEVVIKGDKVRVTGGHKAGDKVRVIEKLEEYPGGSYEARIEIREPNNPNNYIPKTNNEGVATMFPDHWTENRIKVEIDSILKNPGSQTRNSKIWIGTSSSGVKIRVILDNNGKVITAYPIKP